MSQYENLYCKLFVDTGMDEKSLIELVGNIVTGSKVGIRTVITEINEIDIIKNDDFDIVKKKANDGFLFFRYYFDIEPKEYVGLDQREYISSVAQLLQSLWHLGFNAVCACDFEEELPRMGGFNPNRR
jgi:hypothetical protein